MTRRSATTQRGSTLRVNEYEEALAAALDSGVNACVGKSLVHANRIARKDPALKDALERQLYSDFAILARASLEVAKAEPHPMATILTGLAQHKVDPTTLAPLEPYLPKQTTAFREFNVLITGAALQQTPPEDRIERARLLNNLGYRLSKLGRREDALADAQEALTVYRELAQQRPDAFLPDLARSLGAMGLIHENSGNAIQAFSCFEEGVAHLYPLFELNHDAFSGLMGVLVSNSVEMAQTSNAKVSDTTRRALALLVSSVE
jgi:tetratricopeptide (TPR) repeat protein